MNRSKYVMLVKKHKREMLEVSPSKERVIKRLLILSAYVFFNYRVCYFESSSKIISNLYSGLKI